MLIRGLYPCRLNCDICGAIAPSRAATIGAEVGPIFPVEIEPGHAADGDRGMSMPWIVNSGMKGIGSHSAPAFTMRSQLGNR
jgi:hypothetical protein